jgi:hypothetical protein
MGMHNIGGGSLRATLLSATSITTAVSPTAGPVVTAGILPAKYVVAQAALVYGSGGTTVDAYVQTSIDGGTTWIDVIACHFTTASAVKVSAAP